MRGGIHESFLRHAGFRWLKIAVLLSGLAAFVYGWVDIEPRHNGGSWYGYVLGTISTLLILWLTALGLRKRVITRGAYSLKGWTSAHVYLGLSLTVLATLHTGFQLGWNVHSLAYLLMMLVIASGIFGILAYVRLPEAMSENRGEMTQPQMLLNIRAIDRMIHDHAQTQEHRVSDIARLSLENSPLGGGFLARLQGDRRRCGTHAARKRLRSLLQTTGGDDTAGATQLQKLLDRKADALAQARRHIRFKALLEIWLYVHVPLTFALIAALLAHIISVFFYW